MEADGVRGYRRVGVVRFQIDEAGGNGARTNVEVHAEEERREPYTVSVFEKDGGLKIRRQKDTVAAQYAGWVKRTRCCRLREIVDVCIAKCY